MGFRAEKLGRHMQRNGGVMNAVYMDDLLVAGYSSLGDFTRWGRNTGRFFGDDSSQKADFDIVGEWDGPDADPPANSEPAPLSLRDEIALKVGIAWHGHNHLCDFDYRRTFVHADEFLAARDAYNAQLKQEH